MTAVEDSSVDFKQKADTTVYKVIKTLVLFVTYICIGLFMEITGPTLIDLKILTGQDYENIAFAVSGRNVGAFIGAVVGGVLVDKLGSYGDLVIAFSLDCAAAATAITPVIPNYWVLWVLSILKGITEGLINITAQKLILKMWLEKAASPLHLLHGGFGVGSFVIPLVANPFLAIPALEKEQKNLSALTNSSESYHWTTTPLANTSAKPEEYVRESMILYPYLIAAGVTALVSVCFFAYHITGGKRRDSEWRQESDSQAVTKKQGSIPFKQMFNPATCTGGKFWYGIQVFSLLFIYFFLAVGGESVSGKFIRAYSIDQLGFSTDDGSYINTVFWISFSVGRFSGFFVARWVPVHILVILETGGLLISVILLSIFGMHTTWYWVLMQPVGFFTGPLFPTGIGWADFYVTMTGIGIAIPVLGACVGGIALLNLVGSLYEHIGPQTFLYTLLGYGIAAFLTAVLMDITGNRYGARFTHETKETESSGTK